MQFLWTLQKGLTLMTKKAGRPTTYTEEIVLEICDTIASSSKGLRRLCMDNPHWPTQDTIFTWMKNHTQFSEQYALAKRHQVEVLVDEMIAIADNTTHDFKIDDSGNVVCNGEHIQRSRLRIDLYKWIACKLIPKVYGDRIRHEADITVKQEEAIKQLE
jgi:hypothetical protein